MGTGVDDLIVFGAKYVVYIMVAGFVVFWLLAVPRPDKLRAGLSAVLGLVIVLVFIKIAGSVHSDPRPFVQDPSLKPLIDHAADNGFPSDHSAAAGLMAMLVLLRHRLYGALFWIGAAIVAASRVGAHVHHAQDVIAGLLLGAAAAWLGVLVVTACFSLAARRSSGKHRELEAQGS